MGNTSATIKRINFEDMQTSLKQESTLIINTLDADKQQCLIANTMDIAAEVKILNDYLYKNKDIYIIIYGMNSSDLTTTKKYEQLIGLGFHNVFLYSGGLFEWLLLQDIYGAELFPTNVNANNANNVDILKYKGKQQFNVRLLGNV